jgi:hypothetical protein
VSAEPESLGERLNEWAENEIEAEDERRSIQAVEQKQEDEAPTVVLRAALEIAAKPARATWVLKPYVERASLILMVGAEGTFKSFLALDWALTIASNGGLVVYLSAEGRGMWKRLRAWAKYHHPNQHWDQTLKYLPFVALERPINLSSAETIAALISAIDALAIARGAPPALVVSDTMTRNSDGSVERSTEDAQIYLNGLDQHIRARYGCAVMLLHHIGHAVRNRARGPFALIGSTDANFLLERPDIAKPYVSVRAGRMKDCEPPPPFEIEAHVVTIDETDEDGNPETSLILKATGNAPATRPMLTGKNQKALLAELERLAATADCAGVWTEGALREIGRAIGMHKNSARDAVLGLRTLGYLTSSVGGSRLAHLPESGPKDRKRTESTISAQVQGPKTGTKAQAPLGAVPSVLRPDPPNRGQS